MLTAINKLVDEYDYICAFLLSDNQASMQTTINNHFKKILLLSSASYYETEIQKLILEFIRNKSTDDRVVCFSSNKGISRQYHTYFTWDSKNVNNFLGLFGSEFKNLIADKIEQDDNMKENMKAFLSLGNERNKMVHCNFLIYQLDMTFDEIKDLNIKAEKFLFFLNEQFV